MRARDYQFLFVTLGSYIKNSVMRNTILSESYTINPVRRSHILTGGYLLATKFITIKVGVIRRTDECIQPKRIVW